MEINQPEETTGRIKPKVGDVVCYDGKAFRKYRGKTGKVIGVTEVGYLVVDFEDPDLPPFASAMKGVRLRCLPDSLVVVEG